MPDKKFELGDYIEVKDRIRIFYELYGDGRLVTDEVILTNEPDNVPRVMVRASAYRTVDDPHPGVGYSWLQLPGSTPYTRGSEVENAETSAWGRAIASLGILIDRSIASAQEVQNKAGQPATEAPEVTSDGLIGTVEVGKSPVDMNLRQTPDGGAYGFKLKNGRKAYQALAVGPLAQTLAVAGLEKDQRVTVWGEFIVEVPFETKDGRQLSFARILIERIKGDDFELPAQEADTIPLFSDEEQAAIVAQELAEAAS